MIRNVHPVDELAENRAAQKALAEREAELKAEISKMMAGKDSLGGNAFIARQTITERKGGLDDGAMRKDGIDPDKYRKPTVTVYSICVEARVQEDA